jgi:hypothetical protein
MKRFLQNLEDFVMGKHGRTLANRLLTLLARYGGAVSHQRVHDAPMSKAEIAQAVADTAGLVAITTPYVGKTRRKQRTYALTELGHARACTLRKNYHPTRLTIQDWKAQLDEVINNREPIGLQIARDREDARLWRAHEKARIDKDRARRAAAEAREKPEPKRPSAGRNRSEEELEARREWARSKGFSPRDPDADDEAEEPWSPITGQPVPARATDPRLDPRTSWEGLVPAQPAIAANSKVISTPRQISDFEREFREMNRVNSSLNQPERIAQSSPKPVTESDRAEEARILARFNDDPYGGELLPNGKIRYDNRDWTLKGWERERFKNAS